MVGPYRKQRESTLQCFKKSTICTSLIDGTDTGCGISPADLEHIFDPFYTTKQESQEREGTGLGLTIAHQIVQEHGGHIEVKSELGRGTTFLVNVPAVPARVLEAPMETRGV